MQSNCVNLDPAASTTEFASMPAAAMRLLTMAAGLDCDVLHERSFKLVAGRILDQRLLVSVPLAAFGHEPSTLLRKWCDALAMPALYWPAMEANLPDARYVHLGFEQAGRGAVYKIYLEFPTAGQSEPIPGSGVYDRPLVHLAFKWDPERTSVTAVAHYRRLATPSPELVRRVLAGYYSSAEARNPMPAFAEHVFAAALRRMSPTELVLLEVREQGNPRRSFDLGVYDALLQVADIADWLGDELWQHLAIDGSQGRRMLAAIETERVGHVAGGIARDGQEFVTVYYGARRRLRARP